MQPAHSAQVAFYLTGQPAEQGQPAFAERNLRPALFATRSDLTALRYDFPLLLIAGRDDASAMTGLSAAIDAALAANAARLDDDKPGADKLGADKPDTARPDAAKPDLDRLRDHAYALERELRRLLAEQGGSGRLGALRIAAMERLGAGNDRALADSMRRLAAALPNDAALMDCGRTAPARAIAHLHAAAERPRLARMRAAIERLTQKVADILDAAQARSEAGHTPQALRAAIGTVQAGVFDFVAFSRVLGRAAPAPGLPESRWRRLHWLLSVLQSQRFFPEAGAANDGSAYEFTFSTCFDALRAWRERLPKAIELAKAMAIAELEIAGEYDEARHDAVFALFGARGLDPADAARFPSYLVLLNVAQMTPADVALALEALDAGLPMKLLLQTDDVLSPAALGDGACTLGIASRQLCGAALASGNAFVMQASAAQLLPARDRLFAALADAGPALLSVFSGAGAHSDGIPPYLLAAAATECRAFPSFVFDPSAGPDAASRFSLAGNPQPESDWPPHELTFQDADCQRGQQTVAFTLVDLLACDRRYAADFAGIAAAGDVAAAGDAARAGGVAAAGGVGAVPVAEAVAAAGDGIVLPYLLMLDADNRLHKVVADERLVRAARRCRDLWHALQEQGGIHNSHAERAVAEARAGWEDAGRQQSAASLAAPAAEAAATAPVVAVPTAGETEPSPDEPYIETARCSSCNECINLNSTMFAYNQDKQAFIANVSAGTYRQLVEAAESCQVAIIHPGKPRNPNEPGLEELVARAAAFA